MCDTTSNSEFLILCAKRFECSLEHLEFNCMQIPRLKAISANCDKQAIVLVCGFNNMDPRLFNPFSLDVKV